MQYTPSINMSQGTPFPGGSGDAAVAGLTGDGDRWSQAEGKGFSPGLVGGLGGGGGNLSVQEEGRC